jgi:Na+/H+ antiporter NhaD/arsenite permease-like protein
MQPTAPPLAAGIPFVGLLASMSVFPIVAPRFWQRRMGIVAFAWIALLLIWQAAGLGIAAAAGGAWHALVSDYVPFVSLLLALFTAGGGVLLRGGLPGTPAGNTAMLLAGMILGLVMGTTGASMVLINPLLHANAHRRRKVHLVVFLVVLVANASGALTPLGNPPLYIGLLHGVPFFWPARHLLAPFLVVTALVLATFYLLDRILAAKEPPAPARERLRVRGWGNLALILVVVTVVLAEGFLPPWQIILLGEPMALAQLATVMVLLAVTVVSAAFTPRAIRQANDFSWHPMTEVMILFAAIFLTIGPVMALLELGIDGPVAPLLRLAGGADPWPLAYFWLTGLLSAFLDNAPTYLVFFELAGVRPAEMPEGASATLAAISAGAVFFGGLTYIGNAPNMMLRAIAAHRGVRMPGFFGFMLLASGLMLPVLAVVGLLFFA